MEPNPHVIPTPRYAAAVPPDLKGGETRLVFAAPKEPCTTQPDKNSPPLLDLCEIFELHARKVEKLSGSSVFLNWRSRDWREGILAPPPRHGLLGELPCRDLEA